MKRPPMPDCYDYVRRHYGVPAYVGARVRIENREGVLVRSTTGQYVEVRFDGERRVTGPYHPTDGIEYLPPSPQAETTKGDE